MQMMEKEGLPPDPVLHDKRVLMISKKMSIIMTLVTSILTPTTISMFSVLTVQKNYWKGGDGTHVKTKRYQQMS